MAIFSLPSNEQLSAHDPWLAPYHSLLQQRLMRMAVYADRMLNGKDVVEYAAGHLHYGLHKHSHGWVLRERAPSATAIYLHCEASKWADSPDFAFERQENGDWELRLPQSALHHLDHYKLHMFWGDGSGYRVPAWARYVVQDEATGVFDAVVWEPEEAYAWADDKPQAGSDLPLIYEAHVGMSGQEEGINTYVRFADEIIPRIKAAGYDVVQLMAIAEHPYYGSFGYHVSSFFAPSSRFGTPDDLKYLVDAAHKAGLRVVMDIVHSHAVKNEIEGISRYDGTLTQFFHEGPRGDHEQWDSRVFDYGKPDVVHFLLSNCRYWLEEFHFDGFRFDGVTSMLYTHHGMGRSFSDYSEYFRDVDPDALGYLSLANHLTHGLKPSAITIAEEMSGMPGIAAALGEGGVGFDYRLSMGVPDLWIKYLKEKSDEDWRMSELAHELSQHRPEERTISYAESHDQALVGDKTIMFRLADKDMYDHMLVDDENLTISRAVALHKMIRLLTASLNNGGYMNFMGNEFGHPEWIDFPRLENGWSYKYARRQWQLVDDKKLKYHLLGAFDKAMLALLDDTVDTHPENVLTNDGDHVLAFRRGDLLFAFNFDPVRSFTEYGVAVPEGEYGVALTTDEHRFGGFDRINTKLVYPSDGQVKLYLPARTAIVLKKR